MPSPSFCNLSSAGGEDSIGKSLGGIVLLMAALTLLAACTNDADWSGPNRTPAQMRSQMMENMSASEFEQPLGSAKPEGALPAPGTRPDFEGLPPPHPSRPPGERD